MEFGSATGKKYQCFVCGVQFASAEDGDGFAKFRDHILESHEEGREYVVCPFRHCGAPVRDLRAHHRARHASLPMPKSGQMRATVWRDFSPRGDKKRTKVPRFREGYFDSAKMGRQIHYRSGYEQTVYECLDLDEEVLAFNAEPFEIPYIHKGRQHKYIPDLVVKYIDGSTYLYEVKPASQTSHEKNVDKWFAAEEACRKKGWVFEVLTEQGIEKMKCKVKRQLRGGGS